MDRYYLVPVEGHGFTVQDARRPMYLDAMPDPDKVGHEFLYYGVLPTLLLHLPNVSQAAHDTLVAQAGVIAFPADLANNVGGALATVTAAMEARLIPSEWVTAATTYNAILTRIRKLFLFTQRFQGAFKNSIIEAVWDNDVQVNAMPGDMITYLQEAAASLGVDTSGISGTTTVRDAVGILSQRLP